MADGAITPILKHNIGIFIRFATSGFSQGVKDGVTVFHPFPSLVESYPKMCKACGTDNKLVIHFPGGGLYYWWQHGALMSLRSMADLTDEVSVVRLGGI